MTGRLTPLDLRVESETPLKVTQGIAYNTLSWTWATGEPPAAATVTMVGWLAGNDQVWTVGAGLTISGRTLIWDLGLVVNAPGRYLGTIRSDASIYGAAFRSNIIMDVTL